MPTLALSYTWKAGSIDEWWHLIWLVSSLCVATTFSCAKPWQVAGTHCTTISAQSQNLPRLTAKFHYTKIWSICGPTNFSVKSSQTDCQISLFHCIKFDQSVVLLIFLLALSKFKMLDFAANILRDNAGYATIVCNNLSSIYTYQQHTRMGGLSKSMQLQPYKIWDRSEFADSTKEGNTYFARCM